tara:strand:+ start:113 stop:388 length:276 start_codon:yes stop_codon:yes gene_type:complete
MTDRSKDALHKKFGMAAILVGWFVTIAAFVYNFATTNANYAHRIATIEQELLNLDSRMDVSEAFRIELAADLAEIKTDLLWIRRTMEEQGR